MAFTLDNVVPWGRCFDEYVSMFSLSEEDLSKKILGCGDGPASFNCELVQKGGKVVSVDPIYRFSAFEIENRIQETYATVMEQTRQNRNEFVWEHISSVQELGRIRTEAMNLFLDDFRRSRDRYIPGELPRLPFEDDTFELALCSHFLFLYSEHFSLEFHITSIMELCRVARDVRVFPLLELGSRKSRHLESVVSHLEKEGFGCAIERVPYEFQKGGHDMLTVKRP